MPARIRIASDAIHRNQSFLNLEAGVERAATLQERENG